MDISLDFADEDGPHKRAVPPYDPNRSFGGHLSWHVLENGTRPDGSPDIIGIKVWTRKEFALEIGLNPRTVGNWFNNINAPNDINSIEKGLFETSRLYDEWRLDLRRSIAILEDELAQQNDKDKASISKKKRSVQIYNIPPRIKNFIGRSSYLERIKNCLCSSDTEGFSRVVAINNFGGVGKTSLAIEFAYLHGLFFGGVIWCTGRNHYDVINSLAVMAKRLHVINDNINDEVFAANALIDWLSAQENSWLLIFDNVASPISIKDFITCSNIKILITSRFSDWSDICESISLDVLSDTDSVALLEGVANQTDTKGASQLASDLEGLPLALNQAAVTCRLLSMTFSEYHKEYKQFLMISSKSIHYPYSVYATFQIAIRQIQPKTDALILLSVLSFCGAERIPVQLIAAIFPNESKRAAAILALVESSFIRVEKVDKSIQYIYIHRLIQLVARYDAGGQHQNHAKELLIECLIECAKTFNELNPENFLFYEVVQFHTICFIENLGGDIPKTFEMSYLLWLSGRYALFRGAYGISEKLLSNALDICARHLSEELGDLNPFTSPWTNFVGCTAPDSRGAQGNFTGKYAIIAQILNVTSALLELNKIHFVINLKVSVSLAEVFMASTLILCGLKSPETCKSICEYIIWIVTARENGGCPSSVFELVRSVRRSLEESGQILEMNFSHRMLLILYDTIDERLSIIDRQISSLSGAKSTTNFHLSKLNKVRKEILEGNNSI